MRSANNWGDQWTLVQNIGTDGAGARNELRKGNGFIASTGKYTSYDDAFNDTSENEPHYRALIHNGLTSYRLVGNQSRI